jgi:hypothetical protein
MDFRIGGKHRAAWAGSLVAFGCDLGPNRALLTTLALNIDYFYEFLMTLPQQLVNIHPNPHP